MPASAKARAYLDAIAEGFFNSSSCRNWMLAGTKMEVLYRDAEPLIDEHRAKRWSKKSTKQPFWANYWCGKDSSCTCRIDGSQGLESDAIFFLRNTRQAVLAIHVEYKHVGERFGFGQPEAYPLRAQCFAETHAHRPTVNAHNDWMTVLICGPETLMDPRKDCFDRVILHKDAAVALENWPQ